MPNDASPRGRVAIEQAIRGAARAGRPALAPFVTAGFPDRESFPGLLEAVARAADLVEVGVPFSDPMADGVTIQHSSRRALAAGVNLTWILDVLRASRLRAPVILMSYLNPLLAYGITRLSRDAQQAGVAGAIVPDLPFEECGPLRDALDACGLALIQLVTPVTPADRLQRLCQASRGFVYAVTVTGTTGGNARQAGVFDYLDRVRAASALPVLAGFGIRNAAQMDEISQHSDGAIVGSALIECIERGEDPVLFLKRLRPTATGEVESTS